jgi:hypothetical protein
VVAFHEIGQLIADLLPNVFLAPSSRVSRRLRTMRFMAVSSSEPRMPLSPLIAEQQVRGLRDHGISVLARLRKKRSTSDHRTSIRSISWISGVLSLHAWEGYTQGRAAFAGGIGGSFLPGVPVAFSGDVNTGCTFGPGRGATGHLQQIVQVDTITFVVLLLPANLIKVGRKRIWHVRDEIALSLPENARRLLTRNRSGRLTQCPSN